MTKSGKRVRHKETEYKSDRIPADKDDKMSPVAEFTNEIVFGVGEAKPGDVLLIAKPVENPEEAIPEGSLGCFISKTGNGIRATLDSLLSKVNSLEAENARLAAECQESKMERQRRCADESFNDLVNLFNALESVTIKNVFPNAERLFGKRYLRFSHVISKLKSPQDKEKLTKNAMYKKLSSIKDLGFDQVASYRNFSTYPSFINIDRIKDKRRYVGDGCYLGTESKKCFELSSAMFDQLLKIEDFENIISSYNSNEENLSVAAAHALILKLKPSLGG